MIAAPTPINENKRLEALYSTNILHTLPEESYQNIAKLASIICETPISMVTFMAKETQFIKSSHGIEISSAPRDISFCGHALMTPFEPMIVLNTLKDERFHDNPHVLGDYGVRFYAGIPILSPDNLPIGTLCLFDMKPNKLKAEQLDALKILAGQIQNLLTLHRSNQNLLQSKKTLEAHNEVLRNFSYMISHDIKAPIGNIKSLLALLLEDYAAFLPEDGKELTLRLSECSEEAVNFINGLIEYTKSTFEIHQEVSIIEVVPFFNKITKILQVPDNIKCAVLTTLDYISVPKTPFLQIMTNLISNSIKYNEKENGQINIELREEDTHYRVKVKDNGIGISTVHLSSIFNLFYMVDKEKAKEKNSTGIGMAIVKKLVENLDGKIEITSQEGEWTEVNFSIKKYY